MTSKSDPSSVQAKVEEPAEGGPQGEAPTSEGAPTGVASIPDRDYDNMPLGRLREIAKDKGVTLNPDVEKSHLITQLRAYDSSSTGV